MQAGIEDPLHGFRYSVYVDHLKGCTECGRTRCPVGEVLCSDYLADARLQTRSVRAVGGDVDR